MGFGCLSAFLFHGLSYCVFEWYGIFILGFSVVMSTQIYIIAQHVIADWKDKKCATQAFWLGIIGFVVLATSFTLWNLENNWVSLSFMQCGIYLVDTDYICWIC